MSGDRWDDLRARLAASEPDLAAPCGTDEASALLAERDTLAESEAVERRQRIAYQEHVDVLAARIKTMGDADDLCEAFSRVIDEMEEAQAEAKRLRAIVRRFAAPPFDEGFQEVDAKAGHWIKTVVWGDGCQSEHQSTPIDPDDLKALRAALTGETP